ncbi:MAG: glycosyltransferase, partial [Spirochaetaceae bacterium]|nr:glycosyltransferase [Spirochaetaceae bacterium]
PDSLRITHPPAAPEKPVRLVMVARFQKQKDHPTLLAALAEIKDAPWRLELIGDGPEMEKIQNRAEELGLAGRIEFSGQRRDIPERLKEADVFVLASQWEGFPRSILEAMRAGLPVIAADVGGCRESVMEGGTGHLVPKEDAGALREKLEELIYGEEKRQSMGKAGRARYEEEFTFEAMYAKTRAVYETVLSRKATA